MGANLGAKLRENPMTIVVSAFAAFGGFLYGYDTGTISGILEMPYFKLTFGTIQSDGSYALNSGNKGLIVSILSAGTFFGALGGYPCSDFLGRRWGLILACGIFSIGVIFQTAATATPLFVVGRVVAGLGVGIISCIVPMYQSECAPKWIRGLIVSAYQWFITIGLLIAAIINNGTKDIPNYGCYRIPIGIQLIWGCILAVGMFILPESPRYLVLKGQIERAYQSQARLASRKIDDPQVDADVKELIANTELMKVYGSGTYADCFKMGSQKNLIRTLVGIFLQAWQQLTGINFIFYYGTTFFALSGISNAFIITIATNVVNVFMTIPGMLLMDKLGRRNILIIGAAGMLICEYIVAIVGTVFQAPTIVNNSTIGINETLLSTTLGSTLTTVAPTNQAAQKTLIVFVCIYIAFFASTWGPAAWVVTGELYPISIRAKCMSLSSASNWLFNFALGYATPYMVDTDKANLGSKVFFIWGSTCFGCLIFAVFCIWETKGLSLEQVNYLVRNSSPIKSSQLNKLLKSGAVLENEISSSGPTTFPPGSNNQLPPISNDITDPNELVNRSPYTGERI